MASHQLPFKASLLAVTISLAACGGGSSSSSDDPVVDLPNTPAIPDTPDAPGVPGESTPLPTYIMNMNGGDGAEGGDGGRFYVVRSGANGAIRVSGEATIDPTVDSGIITPELSESLGDNPLIVSEDMTIEVNATDLSAGTIYGYDDNLYVYDGAMTEDEVPEPVLGNEATRITGIKVEAGATLTISTTATRSTLNIVVEGDIVNNGIITAVQSLEDIPYPLSLQARVYSGNGAINLRTTTLDITADIIINNGSIDVSGERGGYAGSDSDPALQLNGVIVVNNGTLLAEGEAGNRVRQAAKGHGVGLFGFAVLNNGTIDSSNAAGYYNDDEGDGFSGNGAVVLAGHFAVVNRGFIDVSGDDGTPESFVDGGDGGYAGLTLDAQSITAFKLNNEELSNLALGLIDAYDETASPFILNSGSVNANGGVGVEYGNGGDAGTIGFFSSNGYAGGIIASADIEPIVTVAPPVLFNVTGQISLDGGNAGDTGYQGGDGGEGFFIQLASEASNNELHLSGITAVNAEGGDGAEGAGGFAGMGGSGGEVVFQAIPLEDMGPRIALTEELEPETTSISGPDVVIDTDLNLSSGDSSTPISGSIYVADGGSLLISATSGDESGANITINSDINANRGLVSGQMTSVYYRDQTELNIVATNNISISGSIQARGAELESTIVEPSEGSTLPAISTPTTLDGSDGGNVTVASELGDINISSSLDLSGGNGISQGGFGGTLNVQTDEGTISLTSSFTSTGGNADVSELDSIGGDGGDIILKSLRDTSGTLYTIPTTYLLSGGDGAEVGSEGQIVGYNIEIEEFDCLAGSCPELIFD